MYIFRGFAILNPNSSKQLQLLRKNCEKVAML